MRPPARRRTSDDRRGALRAALLWPNRVGGALDKRFDLFEIVGFQLAAEIGHAAVGERVLMAERQGRALDDGDLEAIGVGDAPLDGAASIRAKRTSGSPNPEMVAESIAATQREIDAIAKGLA